MASGFRLVGTDLDSIFDPWHSGWPQASATEFEIAGYGDINQRYATLATGTAAAATDFKTSAGADLNTIFAAYGSTYVRVATQPGNVSGSTAAGLPSGTVTSGTTTCAGTKGKGAYTYTWHIASGSGVTFTAGSSATTAVTGTVPAGQTISGTMYCTISDGVTSANTNTVNWSIQNTTPAFSGAQHVYTSGSGTEVVPTGATNVIIEENGGGVGGGNGITQSGVPKTGYGGGSGAYCRSVYTCSGGQTLAYVVGAGGAAETSGTASTVSSGTLAITTMTAASGTSAQGGTASGGNQANTSGGAGAQPLGSGTAGVPPAGEYYNTGQTAGAGGRGGTGAGNPGSPGVAGYVSFYYPA